MFLKSYKVKSNVHLKSSEVKTLRQRIQKEFPNANPELLIGSKSNVTLLKLVTSGGFTTYVFCADKIPMFFENEANQLVPTVYSLWEVTDLLPYFTIHANILAKLGNGADCMLPGVIPQGVGMNMYGHYKTGQLVAINLTSNKSAVGVGYLPRSSNDMYMSGGHGVAIKILHLLGDKLWAHEPALTKKSPQSELIKLTEDDFPALGCAPLHKKENQSTMEMESLLEKIDLSNAEVHGEIKICEKVSTEDEGDSCKSENQCEKDQNASEILLKNAFLTALKINGRNLQLPLLTSNFYRLYVLPESEEPLDLRKTKYKKLSNFLNEMVDQGFIVVREEAKGVDKITSIDLQHPELVNFIPGIKNSQSATGETPLFHSALAELYFVTDITAPFFTKFNIERNGGIPALQIKKIIKEYVKQNLVKSNYVKADEISYILDECLEKICNIKFATINGIVSAVMSQMHHSYQVCNQNDAKANKPLIEMSLATRSKNKKVTLVSNIKHYGIIIDQFIKLCKQGAAASATIAVLPSQNREVLQIQGNQVRFVYDLLTGTYKIPPRCILGLHLAKDSKKHKNK